jgi:hypothetical protein
VRKFPLLIIFLALTTDLAFADCLTDAANFANRICGEVSNRGSSRLVTGSGELNAEAKGLIRQLLGSAGGELKGQTEFTGYENVLREQLTSELLNVRQCRVRMAEAAMKQVCTSANVPIPRSPPANPPPTSNTGGPGGLWRFGVFIPTCSPGMGYSLEYRQCISATSIGGVIPCSADDRGPDGRPNCR